MAIKLESLLILDERPLSSLGTGQFAVLTKVPQYHTPVKVGDIVVKGHDEAILPMSSQWVGKDVWDGYMCRPLFKHERIVIDFDK